jgi:hypothetical protein
MSVKVFMSCPACHDEGYNSQRSQWYHSNCDGSLYLTDNAELECYKCWHKSHISKWEFKCNNGRHDYRVASSSALAQALSTSSQMVNAGGLRWLRKALESL